MSRHEVLHDDKGLAFGYDHACGLYLQIWDRTKSNLPDSSNILVDEDEVFDGLTLDRMVILIKEHGFTVDELDRGQQTKRA